MTTVEILFRYSGQPSEPEIFALANAREVYGIRRLSFDREVRTLRVEYDATRLNAAMVTQLVCRAGLEIAEELALIPSPATEPEPIERPSPNQGIHSTGRGRTTPAGRPEGQEDT